jgi:hypothetical protein
LRLVPPIGCRRAEAVFPTPIREKARKSNPDEPAWQDMEHETA